MYDLEVYTLGTPFFAGWGTLALVNAGIAAGLNRNRVIWLLLSLFVGPIATFLLVFSGKYSS